MIEPDCVDFSRFHWEVRTSSVHFIEIRKNIWGPTARSGYLNKIFLSNITQQQPFFPELWETSIRIETLALSLDCQTENEGWIGSFFLHGLGRELVDFLCEGRDLGCSGAFVLQRFLHVDLELLNLRGGDGRFEITEKCEKNLSREVAHFNFFLKITMEGKRIRVTCARVVTKASLKPSV